MKSKKAPCYFFPYVYFWSSPELDWTWVIANKQNAFFALCTTPTCPSVMAESLSQMDNCMARWCAWFHQTPESSRLYWWSPQPWRRSYPSPTVQWSNVQNSWNTLTTRSSCINCHVAFSYQLYIYSVPCVRTTLCRVQYAATDSLHPIPHLLSQLVS